MVYIAEASFMLRLRKALFNMKGKPSCSFCIAVFCSIQFLQEWAQALPVGPICVISFVLVSSLLSVGQLAPSSLASVSSSFVPMIFDVDFVVSICPKRGTLVLYLLLSAVGRSSITSLCEEKLIFARSLLIFLRKKLAMTVVGVW